MSTHSLNLRGVLSETRRIINAHSRHFLALSVLFLLPLSFAIIIYPSISLSPSTISLSRQFRFVFSTPDLEFPAIDDKSQLLLPVLYGLFVLVFSLFATISITYSTFHGFYGRPVKFLSSIKSILFSFFPLLVTLLAAQIILGLIIFALGGLTVFLYNGLALIGAEINYDSVYFIGFGFLITFLLVGVLIFVEVKWYLSSVVVVVESEWGLSPLKRSSYLLKGMEIVAFKLIILFGLLFGLLSLIFGFFWTSWSSNFVLNAGEIPGSWWVTCAASIVQTIVYAGFMTIFTLYSIAANAVLFMYCKALRGELAFEIAEEFSHEYVCLPFDDGKVSHVVYVV